MYQRILVAVDNTELSQQAFQKALSLAQAFTANLHIINVLSPLRAEYQDTTSLAFSGSYYPDTLNDVMQEEWVNIQEIGWNLLQSLEEKAKQQGIKVEITQQIGQPEQEITDFARNWQADLIVIGSHGRKGISEFLFGSVSNYVSHHVPCSVLLVHSQTELQNLDAEEASVNN
ncbi:MAG: universal stress protein [Hydrococcus sp. SU_1_0]|nr:universal stress protein [Hydrococcus sp. SU_1_0]